MTTPPTNPPGETPRTDAVELQVGKWLARYAGESHTLVEVGNFIHQEFDAVRQLERELAAARAEVERLTKLLATTQDQLTSRERIGNAREESLRARLTLAEQDAYALCHAAERVIEHYAPEQPKYPNCGVTGWDNLRKQVAAHRARKEGP